LPFHSAFSAFEIGQPARDHVVAVFVPRDGRELDVLDWIPLSIGEGWRDKDAVTGLLLLNRLLGAVTIFGGNSVAAAICLCGLLSVGWSVGLLSVGWSVGLLLVGWLVGDAEAFANRQLVGRSVGVALCTVASWLLLLYPTAKCLGFGHSEHCGFLHRFSPYFPRCAAA
jgi:hypothetical protein